jgi:hypothetical protein
MGFMAEISGNYRYREVLSSGNIFVFDEWDDLSINRMFLTLGFRVWLWNDFFDAHPSRDNLVRVTREIDAAPDYHDTQRIRRKGSWITWEHGRIFAWSHGQDATERVELAYAHFQKRVMEVRCNPEEKRILCLPDGFEPYRDQIPAKHRLWAVCHRLLDRKHLKRQYLEIKYWLIVKTASIRQKFYRRRS